MSDKATHLLVVPYDEKGPGFLADFVNRATLHGFLVRTEVLTTRSENGEEEKTGLRAVAW